MTNNKLTEKLLKLVNERANKKTVWTNSKLNLLRTLQIDDRGYVGEKFLFLLFQSNGSKVKWFEDETGDADLEIDGYKIEVKTATLGSDGKNFQHEGIKESEEWDFVFFLDIGPQDIYLTIVPRAHFKFHKKSGAIHFNQHYQSIHFRAKDKTKSKATGAGYKVDFLVHKLSALIQESDIINLWKQAIQNSKCTPEIENKLLITLNKSLNKIKNRKNKN